MMDIRKLLERCLRLYFKEGKKGGTYIQMKLYHEDCIKVLQSMPNESIDLVVTDPPYLMDFVSHRRKDLYAPIVGDNLGGQS